MRGWVALFAVLVLAGCGEAATDQSGEDEPVDGVQLIAGARAALEDVESFTFVGEFESTSDSDLQPAEGDSKGQVDSVNRRALMEYVVQNSQIEVETTMIVEAREGGRLLYLVPEENRHLTEGKAWVGQLSEDVNPDGFGFEQQFDVLAEYAESGATVERRGEEEVNGIPATRYRIDKPVITTTDGEGGSSSTGSFHGDVWLAENGVPVKMVYESGLEDFEQSVRVEVTSLNEPVDIPDPADEEIYLVGPDDEPTDYIYPR